MSWIPVDAAARVMLDMLRAPGPPFSTYHLAHPRPVPWRSLFTSVVRTLNLQPVTYAAWVERLRKSRAWLGDVPPEREVAELRRNPALKLIDYFEQAHVCDMDVHAEHRTGGPVRTKAGDVKEVRDSNEAFQVPREALGLPTLAVKEAERVSPSLSEEALPQLTEKDAMQWLQYWKSIGYLD